MTGASSQLLPSGSDTIAAVATAAGRSAFAVIRVSGANAFRILESITRRPPPPARSATLLHVYGADGEPIDQALVTAFPGPHSYTGEDVVELSVHGGWIIAPLVLERIAAAGARQALPGEFTRRAYLNGKLDLLQAEAIVDLIDSRSRGAARAAIKQLDGGLTHRILHLRSAILDLEALIAYDVDFPEEDDGPIARERISDSCRDVLDQLRRLLATAGSGELLRDGALVVIAGEPNAGKSSLFNALLGRSRSLVTDIPGTTRDAIEAVIDVEPWSIRLVDTAGLREASETVERLGIEVAEDYIAQAQVLLVCGDSVASLSRSVAHAAALSNAPMVTALTKADLRTDKNGEKAGVAAAALGVSAMSGEGIESLLRAIAAVLLTANPAFDPDLPLLLRARHQRAVAAATSELELFLTAFETSSLPMTIAGTHLRAASAELEALIGRVDVEDVLDRLFRSFCVGK